MPLAVAGEEVGSTGAAGWQTAGITGAGVKVAIINVGFAGLASAQATGDLPASVTTQDDCAGGFSTVTQHGTAVAEIVHELAPNAQLLLACVDTPADLATAEQWAVAQGAQIINHSVAWFDTALGDGQGGAARRVEPGDGVVDDLRSLRHSPLLGGGEIGWRVDAGQEQLGRWRPSSCTT